MLRHRVIPCLLLQKGGLVKTVKFRNPTYVGDPINAIRIFNDKEVDELMLLDIRASRDRQPPQFDLVADVAKECFMPLAYGGGIRDVGTVGRLFSIGVEKVALNTCAVEQPAVVEQAARAFGSQSIIVSIDAKRRLFGGYEAWVRGATRRAGLDPVLLAKKMEALGAGEILLNSIDRDGTGIGYDLWLLKAVSQAVDVPVVACGGAGKLDDFAQAVKRGGASAVAAGSMFVFQGPHRAVLITYPGYRELERLIC